ncbi:hypothetical protein ECHLIB_0850 [Ehrlichia chaffeensis str. Liberty]|nr:hypothetical protein ECHLIB_0850 [Ehrlichia chaffeensis str. Liberty]
MLLWSELCVFSLECVVELFSLCWGLLFVALVGIIGGTIPDISILGNTFANMFLQFPSVVNIERNMFHIGLELRELLLFDKSFTLSLNFLTIYILSSIMFVIILC